MTGDRRPKIGVMGSAQSINSDPADQRIYDLADRLGAYIAEKNCVLITGATTGLPDRVSRAARAQGCLAIGISPAISDREHVEKYNLPLDAADVIIYTGFGLKGRNVINIRASDIVIIFGGSIGTLNEFTIAYDEGKIIGVLEGSGGVADHIADIIRFSKTSANSMVFFEVEPERLIDRCLDGLSFGY